MRDTLSDLRLGTVSLRAAPVLDKHLIRAVQPFTASIFGECAAFSRASQIFKVQLGREDESANILRSQSA